MKMIFQRGFTLIELMIVVTIICILASLAVPSFLKYRETTLAAKCVANLRSIQDAREAYFMDNPGVLSISGSESAFLAYLGEVMDSGTDFVLVDENITACPYNKSKYSLGIANYTDIVTMPTCLNASADPCKSHVYSAQ